jgi:hypothetical protein
MKRLILFTLLFTLNTNASEVDIEIDPIFFALGGQSFHLGVAGKTTRFELAYFTLKTDEEVHGNDHYDLEIQGGGIKIDYTFQNYYGAFLGFELNQVQALYTHRPSKKVFTRKIVTTAPRIGYRFKTSESIIITTTLAYDILIEEGDEVKVNDDEYTNEAAQFFPSIHIGYKF